MKKRAWIAIGGILAAAPIMILWGAGHNLAPASIWAARYNVPGNGNDHASDIAVDSSGNILVTGSIQIAGPHFDCATIKYSPAGKQLWVNRYKGLRDGIDWAEAIDVDGSGNVYITGNSASPDNDYSDYTTIKYSPAGKQLWVNRYDGRGNGAESGRAIAVDASGNAYVTGQSFGLGTSTDFATIKYSPAGKQLWIKIYKGPGISADSAFAIAVDTSGNAYVTGQSLFHGSGTGVDYATIKYGSNGKQLWVNRYNGPGNFGDAAWAIAVDGWGNVCVTGESTDSDSDSDYATIKYSPNGKQIWAQRYNGPGNGNDWARAIALDDSGNIYVTGFSTGQGTDRDYATIKYGPNGNQLWVKRYNGPGKGIDFAYDIAVDGSGNIYVTGQSQGSNLRNDYATIKYSPNGKQLWVTRYNEADNDDFARAIAVDGSGNVYVTGSSVGSNTGYDYATIKYGPNGKQLWVKRYNGPGKGYF